MLARLETLVMDFDFNNIEVRVEIDESTQLAKYDREAGIEEPPICGECGHVIEENWPYWTAPGVGPVHENCYDPSLPDF